MRVALVTAWNEKEGIAEYAVALKREFDRNCTSGGGGSVRFCLFHLICSFLRCLALR